MLVELNNIHKYYQSNTGEKQYVLSDISLNVSVGQTLAIIGPSGSGKSTLLNILGTLDKPVSGNVLFKGRDVYAHSEQELATIRNKHIGFVFQKHYLLPQLTVLENVLVPVIPLKDKAKLKQAKSRAETLLNMVGLSEKQNKLPGQLSVGECQRASVVRALINEPELILADEPTGSLDNDSAIQLGNLFSLIKKEYSVAIVVVTHSLEFARTMDKVLKLHSGKLIEIEL